MQSASAGYFPLNDPCTVHTHASFSEQPVSKVSINTINGWALMLPVPLPTTLTGLVLKSVLYTIKYATAHAAGDSTIQADVILACASCPTGIVVDGTDLLVYHPKSGYAPPLVNEDKAMLLSSNPGIKQNKGSGSWEHYVDHRRVNANIALRPREAVKLYLAFHVFEYPVAAMNRALCVEVSATWCGSLKE